MAELIETLRSWVRGLLPLPPAALPGMRVRPEGSTDNGLMIQFFTWESKHPDLSWWQHFEREVPNLAELGVTQVWLPPPNKAMVPKGQGYDAYDLWDLGEFDQKGTVPTRWGSKEQLVSAIATAQAHGIDVLIDAVLNHKLGADRIEKFDAVPVDPDNRLKAVGPAREIEGWTAFDFTGRAGKYSELKWTHEHFTGVDWDQRTKTKGVFLISTPKHKGWSKHVDKEFGNYDYLLGVDIDHRHPAVRKDLLDWAEWVLKTTGAAGFRLDAIKHMDRRFLLDFLKTARAVPGKERMFAVAEYWSANINAIRPYIRAFEGLVTFFDVPLHHNLHDASKAGPDYDLRTIFKNTVVQSRPGDAVTFVDNHDKEIDRQIGQTLESWVYSAFKLQAYALILLRKDGHPCVFYGDLYPNDECYDATVSEGLRELMKVRRKFAYGFQREYPVDKNCIAFVREGDATHDGCAVLISNKANNPDNKTSETTRVRLNVGVKNRGRRYRHFLRGEGTVNVDGAGWGKFPRPSNGVDVWVPAQ
ncbi:glycoside hydrolase family 13 protein [Irpex rosettiformis]|uniref:Glycoside hydrolase family 13 protein n=1 Tax=Irpex rosettiformis TaxID=378272 RepID=A0ACB8UAT2_9APHY|nr:glycoside hydrolase family 13 protein [Irpex rosettiformis]